ncbi:MAG: hypothetical protein R3D55_13495 [Chloroflexota bacterium]
MIKLVDLQEPLATSFNLDELRQLCFSLNIDYENVPGETKEAKVRELICYCYRRDHLNALLDYCQQVRPRKKWQRFREVEPLGSLQLALNDQQMVNQLLGELPEAGLNHIAKAQIDVYQHIWDFLSALKIAGNALWREASLENIEAFSLAWDFAESQVDKFAPYFDPEDYRELKRLLKLFANYRLGKVRLYEIREYDISVFMRLIIGSMARRQIAENRQMKEAYEAVFDNIVASFRKRLLYS